jgi:hypothetical protein
MIRKKRTQEDIDTDKGKDNLILIGQIGQKLKVILMMQYLWGNFLFEIRIRSCSMGRNTFI